MAIGCAVFVFIVIAAIPEIGDRIAVGIGRFESVFFGDDGTRSIDAFSDAADD